MEDEKVFDSKGEFLGWWKTIEERYETVEVLGGGSYSVKVNDYSRVFVPKEFRW